VDSGSLEVKGQQRSYFWSENRTFLTDFREDQGPKSSYSGYGKLSLTNSHFLCGFLSKKRTILSAPRATPTCTRPRAIQTHVDISPDISPAGHLARHRHLAAGFFIRGRISHSRPDFRQTFSAGHSRRFRTDIATPTCRPHHVVIEDHHMVVEDHHIITCHLVITPWSSHLVKTSSHFHLSG